MKRVRRIGPTPNPLPYIPFPSLSFPLPNTPDNIAETNAAVFGQSVLLAYHSFNSNLMKFLQFGWKMSKSIVYFFMKVLERDNSLTYQSYPTTNFLPFLSLLLVFFSLIVCTANLASSTPTNMSVQQAAVSCEPFLLIWYLVSSCYIV